MSNLGLRQAKEQIIQFLNGLPFDIEVKRLLLKDLYEEVRCEADRVIAREHESAQKALKEAKDAEST